MLQPNYIYKGKVIRVVDGDTYEIEIDLGFDIKLTKHIRLLDVDTPETWRPKSEEERAHGKEATAFVKQLIDGQEVCLQSVKFGKYRYCAHVYVITDDGQISIAEKLLEHGLAKRENY